MSVYQVCSNKSPGSKFALPQGVIDFPYMHIHVGSKLKIFFEKSQIAGV
jgi:hypothetical protein